MSKRDKKPGDAPTAKAKAEPAKKARAEQAKQPEPTKKAAKPAAVEVPAKSAPKPAAAAKGAPKPEAAKPIESPKRAAEPPPVAPVNGTSSAFRSTPPTSKLAETLAAARAAQPTKRPPSAKPAPQAAPRAKEKDPTAREKRVTAPKAVATPSAPLVGTAHPQAAPDAATIPPPAKRARSSQPGLGQPPSDPTRISLEPGPFAEAKGPEVSNTWGPVEELREHAESSEAARLVRGGSAGDRLREAADFGTSQSLLSTDYYFRQYGAHGIRSRAAEVDDFGFDPHVDGKVKPLLEAMCSRYFRVELVGVENIPATGRALLVANRGGALPWDGLVLRTALRAERPSLPPLRWLAEDSVIHTPFMGVLMNRLGAVRACPENAERLLAQDRLVAVFPEGAQGSRKLFRDRYRLQRFGRGGYVKLALKLGVPIFPTAIIGSEEINPVIGRSRLLGRILGSESVPLTPTFPWFGLAGLIPAPVRWRIAIGAPIDLSSYGPDSADDALVVHRLNEQIRSSLQALIDQGKNARGSALFG